MFGSNISKKNETHTKRRWYPNVQNKRVYSEALDNWVRFRMTTAALRAIDHAGGIDTYLLQLDNRLVDDSNYVTKIRRLIGSTLYHRGELDAHTIKKLNYHRDPPAKLDISFDDKLKKYIENEILEGAEESEPLQ
jgi:ribosomal protein L28